MGLIIYLNGEYLPEDKAVVSVFDHGLLYGDGIFEGIRAYHNRVFKLEEHIDRLYESAHTINLEIGLTKEEMAEVVVETCRRNNLRDAYIRLVVSRGKGDLGLDPRKCPKATVFCIAATINMYPEEFYQKGLTIVTVPTRRNPNESCSPRVKSLNYLNNIMAKMEANLQNAPEGILLNSEGYVAEATGDNIFIIKKGKIITPPIYVGLLEGITRNTVLELARKRGYEATEELFTRMDMYTADEIFLTGTAAEVVPVAVYDGRTIGNGLPGKITKELIADYRELTKHDGPEIFKD